MPVIGQIINAVLLLFMLALLIRMVLSWVPMFSPTWQPKGVVLVVAEAVYTVTDPPIKAVGKVIPPVRMGNAYLDLGFMVVWILVLILRQITWMVFF